MLVPLFYSTYNNPIHLRNIGGKYFGTVKVYGRNNGHKEIAFTEAVVTSDYDGETLLSDGINLVIDYSDFPITREYNQRWYHLKLEIQYQMCDVVCDGTYEGYYIKPLWKKYPQSPSSNINSIEKCLRRIETNSLIIPDLEYSLKSPSSFLKLKKIYIDKFSDYILTETSNLSPNVSSCEIYNSSKKIRGNIASIYKTLNTIKIKHKPSRDTIIYRQKIKGLTKSISDDLKRIVKLSWIVNTVNNVDKRGFRNTIKLSLILLFDLETSLVKFIRNRLRYFRNSIHVEIPLHGSFHPEFDLIVPASWRIGYLRLFDDYRVGIKNEGSSIKLIATVRDLNHQLGEEYDVYIPVHSPLISRLAGGKREYKIIPTDCGIKKYMSFLNSANSEIIQMRLEYVAQVSNSISLYSLVPGVLILTSILSVLFQIIQLFQSDLHDSNIALSVSVIVLYLTYIYSYMTLKEKGYDMPHKKLYWWSVLVLVIIIIAVIIITTICVLSTTFLS